MGMRERQDLSRNKAAKQIGGSLTVNKLYADFHLKATNCKKQPDFCKKIHPSFTIA
ncbi:hypothetical protein NCCP28_23750 [Niallia sp. NCCP-28]|nr:hypothetical protein NCCP28_23750 [Niallia sp. NCCP-28]